MTGANKRKSNPEYERQQFINFFEELSWLLESNKDLNFKKASQFLSSANLEQYRYKAS